MTPARREPAGRFSAWRRETLAADATGAGVDAGRPAITRRARAWVFDLPSDDDRRELAAVRAAAAFLREHPDCFAGGPQADNPAHVALSAVRVYDVFLKPDALPPDPLLCELVRERLTETRGRPAV